MPSEDVKEEVLLGPCTGPENNHQTVLSMQSKTPKHLFLIANIVTTSKAPVTTSDALVTTSDALEPSIAVAFADGFSSV